MFSVPDLRIGIVQAGHWIFPSRPNQNALNFCMYIGKILDWLFHGLLEGCSSLGISVLVADTLESNSHGKGLFELLAEEKREPSSELHKEHWSLIPLTAVINQYFIHILITHTMRKKDNTQIKYSIFLAYSKAVSKLYVGRHKYFPPLSLQI